jgi:hypothetical protein
VRILVLLLSSIYFLLHYGPLWLFLFQVHTCRWRLLFYQWSTCMLSISSSWIQFSCLIVFNTVNNIFVRFYSYWGFVLVFWLPMHVNTGKGSDKSVIIMPDIMFCVCYILCIYYLCVWQWSVLFG